jgi:hypothetical protein
VLVIFNIDLKYLSLQDAIYQYFIVFHQWVLVHLVERSEHARGAEMDARVLHFLHKGILGLIATGLNLFLSTLLAVLKACLLLLTLLVTGESP